MKKLKSISLIIPIVALFACNIRRNSKEIHSDCKAPADMKTIHAIATSMIDRHDNDNIWNLSEVDTTNYAVSEDYFINDTTKSRLVLLSGKAGLSAGSANHLLLFLSCADTLKVEWAGQFGGIRASGIRDLNGDGIMEIVSESGMTWMGECDEHYGIYNFRDGKQHVLFSALSTSFLNCGIENPAEQYKKGDTLETKFDCSIVMTRDKKFMVQQIRTVKIHNGGHSNEEIIKNLKVSIDTSLVGLK